MNHEAKLRIPVSDADHARGPVHAPIVLVQYGDYQCPHCGAAYPITEQLQETLKGEMRFVFRHFSMTQIHPEALNAARAAEAAGMQGRFWQMHSMLFENQDSLRVGNLLAFATATRLVLKKFAKDMESAYVEEKIQEDFRGGVRSGVNGTPTFFINGLRYDGDWAYEPFLMALLETANLTR